jgi:hypothetical protein
MVVDCVWVVVIPSTTIEIGDGICTGKGVRGDLFFLVCANRLGFNGAIFW